MNGEEPPPPDKNPLHIIERRLVQILTLDLREYLQKWIPLSILIGIVGGVGALIFQVLLDFFWNLSYETVSIPWYLILFVPAIGGLVVGFMIDRFAPEAAGHGTDSVIDALHHKGGKIRLPVVPVKVLASSITIGTGGSAGREGPIAQIGAGLASYVGAKLKLSRSDLRVFVIAGMAAGFSAIFKAPLGSAVFAMEVPYRNDLESNAVIPSLISSVVSYVIFIPVFGAEPIFMHGYQAFDLDMKLFAMIFVLGIVVGLIGILFVKTFYLVRDTYSRMGVPFALRTGMGGLMVGIIGLATPEILGLGYNTIMGLIEGTVASIALLLALIIGKIVATSFSIGSGGSGGVFFPSLLIGGAVGGVVASIFDLNASSLLVVVGMGAMMAGVTKTPMAASIMITEMVGGFSVLIPVMIASVISYVITGPNTIYQKQITRRSFQHDISCLSLVEVKDVMTKDVTTIPYDASIEEAYTIAGRSPHYLYPVVDPDDHILGVAPKEKIEEIRSRLPNLSIISLLQSHYDTVPADLEALEAFDLMSAKQISRMLVVDPEDGNKLVGIITRVDLMETLEHLDERHHEY